jgi:phenylpropionate dioxygenase-like ring-hydroxylating dioxygenase large terminal subunit
VIDVSERLRSHWLVAATSAQLRRAPLACQVLETPLVLFRSTETGSLGAMLDRCPHRNAPLSAGTVIGDALQCPYHGWRFDTAGRCVLRPGFSNGSVEECANRAFAVCESQGLVWVKLLDDGHQPAPRLSRWWDDPQLTHFIWTSQVESHFIDALENVLDATHTPLVHAGLVRSAAKPQKFRVTVRVRDDLLEAEYSGEGKQAGWISRLLERDRANSFGRFIPPCTAELEYQSKRGTEFVLNSHFTPESPQRLRVFTTFLVRRSRLPMVVKRAVLTPLLWRVLKQDQQILELQQRNIERFGGADYQYWEGDLLRGLIETWCQTGKFPDRHAERTLDVEL